MGARVGLEAIEHCMLNFSASIARLSDLIFTLMLVAIYLVMWTGHMRRFWASRVQTICMIVCMVKSLMNIYIFILKRRRQKR